MYLKRLEIQGFKSFANKTIMDFLPPKDGNFSMTAVVGPNGSGKSNITDAIRWVMGETSMKNVRAKKNEDVIFNGSETKAAMGSAEVSMVLDNGPLSGSLLCGGERGENLASAEERVGRGLDGLENYPEITITRRLYRTGENEYLVNGVPARLLDVHLLLAHAKFAQHAYSIVGQGMIDRLLTVTPSERKDFFDEASGIKEYQIKQHQASLKLARTTENINQVETLLAEVEPRLKLLGRQVRKLEKRQEVADELLGTQEKYYSILYSRGKNELSELKKKLQLLNNSYRQAFAALELTQSELAALAKDVPDQSESESYRRESAAVKKQIDALYAEHAQQKIKISRLQTQLTATQSEQSYRDLVGLTAVKAVLQNRQRFGKVYSIISELGEVDEEYRLALEVASGNHLSSIVVEDEGVASAAIAFLRENKAGVATFLPVNKIKPRESWGGIQNLLNEDGVFGRAIDLLRFDSKFENIFSMILGDTIVVKNLQVAERIGIGRARMVTLDGDLVEARGVMRGGYRNRQNRLTFSTKLTLDNDKQLAEIQAAISTETNVLVDIERKLDEAKSKTAELSAAAESASAKARLQSVFTLQSKMQGEQSKVNAIMNERNDLSIEVAKIETRLGSLAEEVMNEMKVTVDSIVERVPIDGGRNSEIGIQNYDVTTLAADIQKLKYQLSLIGGIDEEVVKEFSETKERYDFLVAQLTDLKAAMADLDKMIEELDVLMKKRRAVAFKKIRADFGRYFQILFDGGKADLEEVYGEVEDDNANETSPRLSSVEERENQSLASTEERDRGEVSPVSRKRDKILTGIEVLASPPGKKVKYLSMLSGGERTLTSIALICAILFNNPSPFVVLDEVEAALDEANTMRFAKIMSELAKHSQFIVVTHNRVTMHAADALYGVVMGPDGVSKLLSVKMSEVSKFDTEAKNQ